MSQILERVTPIVVGRDPFGIERIWQDLFALTYTSVRGTPTLAQQRRRLVTAMSAIDVPPCRALAEQLEPERIACRDSGSSCAGTRSRSTESSSADVPREDDTPTTPTGGRVMSTRDVLSIDTPRPGVRRLTMAPFQDYRERGTGGPPSP